MGSWRKRLWQDGRTLPDPVKGLKELKRACRDDGKIIMLEYMRSKKEPAGKLMDLFNWVSLYTYGANINRRTKVKVYEVLSI